MQLSDWLAQPMAGYGGQMDPRQQWLMRHPQFGGQQHFPGNETQQPAQSAYQNVSPQGLANGMAFQPGFNVGQLMMGQRQLPIPGRY